jgi:hypothetical protein
MDTPQNKNPFGYDRMTVTELRKVIADLNKELFQLKEDKKEWVGAANETIKDTNKRIESAIDALREGERGQANQEHEVKVAQFLAEKDKTNA